MTEAWKWYTECVCIAIVVKVLSLCTFKFRGLDDSLMIAKVIRLPVYKSVVGISLGLIYCSHCQRSLNTLGKWLLDMEGFV
jgi:hypothetical protein